MPNPEYVGRVTITIEDDDGNLVVAEFTTPDECLLHASKWIDMLVNEVDQQFLEQTG